MLKSLTTRTYEGPAGEPDAWNRPRDARAEERAPWRSPYEQPSRPVDRAAETRDAYARAAARPAPAPRAAAAGVNDFRDLARSIERRRHPSATASTTTQGYPADPAAAPAHGRSWIDEVRQATPRREEHAVPGGKETLAALSRDIARAADKADVARLEEMLTVVLRRLAALEGRRAERTAPPPATDEALSDAEARWLARRARAATQRAVRPAAAAPTDGPARATPRRLWS